jgi:molybdopterin-synthase adenylyltransferase
MVKDGWRLLIRKGGATYACLLDSFYALTNVDVPLLSEVWSRCNGSSDYDRIIEDLVVMGFSQSRIVDTIEALVRARIVAEAPIAASAPPGLTADDLERHDRQLHYWGGFEALAPDVSRYQYQMNLKYSCVAIVGIGGIGSWVAATLGLTGIGTIRAIDPDRVELSNLNRQVLYRSDDIGRLKVDAAADVLAERNPGLRYEAYPVGIVDVQSALRILSGCDFVALTADHPPRMLRRWVAEACARLRIPYALFGAVLMGPLVDPGSTPCFGCYEALLRSKDPDYDHFVDQISAVPAVKSAPTFLGPIAAGLMCKDVIHFLAKAPVDVSTGGHILRIDPKDNAISRLELEMRDDCDFCALVGHG